MKRQSVPMRKPGISPRLSKRVIVCGWHLSHLATSLRVRIWCIQFVLTGMAKAEVLGEIIASAAASSALTYRSPMPRALSCDTY